MIPIGDSVRSRTFPFVNVAIIAVNVAIFAYELTISTTQLAPFGFSELDVFFYRWGAIPACLVDQFGFDSGVRDGELVLYCSHNNETASLFYSMFLHGGWLHLIGNLFFLWVFGDNVEDAMGHIRYALFYVVAGLGATTLHTVTNAGSLLPAIGASGAISGVLGAYLVLYPRARVTAILPFLFFIPFFVPAVVLIGIWFLMQLVNGAISFADVNVANAGGGVAWFAHIGGFVTGVLLVRVFTLGKTIPPVRRPRWAQ